MATPVLREEADARKHNSVFTERQAELEESASKMPKGIRGNFPYLMEINTGVVHPYSAAIAERSDLVVGCYNLEGSFAPEDADLDYDPQGVYTAQERRNRVVTVAPQTAAEHKAAEAAERKRIREEVTAEARGELEAKIRAEMEAKYGGLPSDLDVATTVATPKSATVSTKKPVESTPVVEPAPKQTATDRNIMDALAEGKEDLDAAFAEAMRE